jgi:hypothetical protein
MQKRRRRPHGMNQSDAEQARIGGPSRQSATEQVNIRVPSDLVEKFKEYVEHHRRKHGGERITARSVYVRALKYWWKEKGAPALAK